MKFNLKKCYRQDSFFSGENSIKIQDNSAIGNYPFTFHSLKASILLLIKTFQYELLLWLEIVFSGSPRPNGRPTLIKAKAVQASCVF